MADLVLYELAGADDRLRFSPYCWKSRMALAHKGLTAQCVPWHFTNKEALRFSGQERVPVLIDDGKSIHDSWRIALHLETHYPKSPSLFGGESAIALADFVNRWADTVLLPAITPIILYDIFLLLGPADQSYFRTSREARFGRRLEEIGADSTTLIANLRRTLEPLRQIINGRPFLAGGQPAYADYSLFGMFMWARCVSETELLDADDPLHTWREALLDIHGGIARHAFTVVHLKDSSS